MALHSGNQTPRNFQNVITKNPRYLWILNLYTKIQTKMFNTIHDLIRFACSCTSTVVPQSNINKQKKKNLANIQPSWLHAWQTTHIYKTTQFHLLEAMS